MSDDKMVGKCPRCSWISTFDYKDRHEAICTECLKYGFLVHMRLIPRRDIDHEAVATVKEDYFTWTEYIERNRGNNWTEASVDSEVPPE